VTADFNDPAVLFARLTRTDNSAPVAGKTLTLTMGAESCSQVSDPNGVAACTITPTEAAGPFTVAAGFAGDGSYLASTGSKPFTVTREETTTTYTGPTVIAQGNPVTLSGRLLEDGTTPIAGRTLTLTIGSGPASQNCVTPATDTSGNAHCTIANVTVTQGPQPVKADFAGDGYYLPSADATQHVIIFAFPARGIDALGDQMATANPANVTFWGAQWSGLNTLTGGSAPASFKGFADNPNSKPPACGGTWTTTPGNSSSPGRIRPGLHGNRRLNLNLPERQHDHRQHHQDRRRPHRPRIRPKPRPPGHRHHHRHLLSIAPTSHHDAHPHMRSLRAVKSFVNPGPGRALVRAS